MHGIYEPRQNGQGDCIQVDVSDDDATVVEAMFASIGLVPVGVIYTYSPWFNSSDLMDAGKGDGSVICKRHADSYFLSGAEVISAARAQSAKPLACKWAGTGTHASRFVTCVITGIYSHTNSKEIPMVESM